jgi:hypothetical protein
MADRAARAAMLLNAKSSEFRVVTRRLMQVPSQYTAGKLYNVTMKDGHAVSGSCPDYRYRDPDGGCKHMIAADLYMLRF